MNVHPRTHSFTSLMRRTRAESGMAPALTIAVIIVGVILTAVVGSAIVFFQRTGMTIVDAATRDTQLNVLMTRLQLQFNNLTDLEIEDDTKITLWDQPSKRTAYYAGPLSGQAKSVCVKNVWELLEGASGFYDLVNTETRYETDSCTSDVVSTSTRVIPGFTKATSFSYWNAYGRSLHYVRGQELGETASPETRRANLFDNEWLFPYPYFIDLDGGLSGMYSAREVSFRSVTNLKQMRPGSEPWSPFDLDAPEIYTYQHHGNTYRATFNPIWEIEDPRAQVLWSYRKQINDSEWTNWSGWSEQDWYDQTLYQGARWEIEAKYKVVLGGEEETSKTAEYDWVRPIDAPAPPVLAVTSTKTTLGEVTCPTQTTPEYEHRTQINTDGWLAWTSGRTATYELGQGSRVLVQGSARCVTVYTTSTWAQSDTGTYVKPITSKITTSVDSYLSGATGYVKVTVNGTCPVGTDPRINPVQARDYSGWSDVAAWGGLPGATTSRTFSAGTVNEGQRFRGGANSRCVSPYTNGPISFAEDGWDVRPITSSGWVNAWSGRNGLYGVAGASGFSGCPAGTRYQWEWAQQVNWGGWSGWSGWYASSTTSVYTGAYIGWGGAYRTAAHNRCVTDFATGPVSGTSYSGITYTPLPVPAIPTITDLKGANSCNGKLVQIHGRYNAVAYANSYQVQGRARIPSTNWYTGWISGSASSGNLGLFFSSSQVISANGSQVMIRSVGTNITSAWSSTATVTKSVAGCFN